MPIAISTNPSASLLIAFVVGFALATLVFWPVRRRPRRRRATSARAPKHALGSPLPERADSTATASEGAEVAEENQSPAEPAEPASEHAVASGLPTHLFQQRYAAKFERTRKRLARLRTQLDEG